MRFAALAVEKALRAGAKLGAEQTLLQLCRSGWVWLGQCKMPGRNGKAVVAKWLWLTNMYQYGTLVNGTKDQRLPKLRFLTLSHTQIQYRLRQLPGAEKVVFNVKKAVAGAAAAAFDVELPPTATVRDLEASLVHSSVLVL